MIFHRNIEQYEGLCHTQNLDSHNQGQILVAYKLCVSHYSKTNKGNLIKFHRKVKQNEKVCHTQNLGSHDQGQGHNRRSKICH